MYAVVAAGYISCLIICVMSMTNLCIDKKDDDYKSLTLTFNPSVTISCVVFTLLIFMFLFFYTESKLQS